MEAVEMARAEFIEAIKSMSNEHIKVALNAFDKVAMRYEMSSVSAEQCMDGATISNAYLQMEAMKGRPEGSVNNYRLILSKFFSAVTKPLDKILYVDVMLYLNGYHEERAVSLSTLNRIRSCLSSFFGWCCKAGYIQRNPVELVPKFNEQKKQRDFLTDAELEELRYCASSLRDKALIEFMISSACRIAEICKIRLCDVDWSTGTVQVMGKGKKERVVVMTPKALIAVNAYLCARGFGKARTMDGLTTRQVRLQKHLEKSGNYLDRATSKEYLFEQRHTSARPDGEPFEANLRAEFDAIVQRANISSGKHITPHTMRHTWATLASRRGMSIEDISAYLGHEDISTTMIYITIDQDKVRKEVTRLVI